MSQTPPTLYSVKGYKGAHILIDMRDTDGGIIADVQLIGASSPFSASPANLAPFQMSEALTQGDLITVLAQESAVIYGADPPRIQKATELARTPYAIQNAQRDYMGEKIKSPSMKTLIVKGRAGWYIVEKGNCQCPDNKKGNTCKHRIAAWMHREAIARPLAQARRTTPAKILQELEA
jgi:hypothetical protein